MSHEIKESTDVEFLEWFFCNADFGPADSDVKGWLIQEFETNSGTRVPAKYREGFINDEEE